MTISDRLARLRKAPRLVAFLTQDAGCWIVGSQADFRRDRITSESDWDILVPLALWQAVRGSLPFERATTTRRGGWRFKGIEGEADIDIIVQDVDRWFSDQPYTISAWHPKSGTVLERAVDGYGASRDRCTCSIYAESGAHALDCGALIGIFERISKNRGQE